MMVTISGSVKEVSGRYLALGGYGLGVIMVMLG